MLHLFVILWSASPKHHPSKPHPCNMPHAKTGHCTAILETCAAEVALQHSLFCSAAFFLPKAALQQVKTALQHWKSCVAGKWRFPAAFCGFQSPTFRHPRLGPAELSMHAMTVETNILLWSWDPARTLRTPKTYNYLKSKRRLSGVSPKVTQKWPHKRLFDPKKVAFSHF